MSDGLCDACRNDNHEHHKFALAGICVGCVCNWRPGRAAVSVGPQTFTKSPPSLMRKEDVVRIAEGLAMEELQKRVRLFPVVVAALKRAQFAMNHMGDVLNGHDMAFDDPKLSEISEAFEEVRAAIAKASGRS